VPQPESDLAAVSRAWIRRCRPGAAHEPGAPAVLVSDLAVSYNGRSALRDVTFEVPSGCSVAVAGPNGAGKSTLLRVLAGLLPPSHGHVEVHGHGPCRHVCIAYVPQRSAVDWRFPVTVWDAVMMARGRRRVLHRRSMRRDRQVVRESLESVGLLPRGADRIEQLSGGQQQRMFIARALSQEAQLVLLDEPFAALDLQSKEEVLTLLEQPPLCRLTRIVALHDLGIAATRFDSIVLLHRTLVAYGTPEEVLTPMALQRAYGSCLRVVEGDGGTVVVSDSACGGGVDHDPD